MRKAKVGLEADVAGFIRPVESAKKSVDDLGDELEQLDRTLDKIPLDAAKAGAAMKMLGGDVNSVGDKVTSLGEKNTGLAVLDSKIRATRSEVKKLAEEFVKTGDIDVFRKLGDAEGRLRMLTDTRKKLAEAIIPDPHEVMSAFKRLNNVASQAGAEFGKMFSGGITGVLSTPVLGPIILAAVLAAIAAVAPLILSGIGGILLGAGALGGVGLGILGGVLGNPVEVGKAWGAVVDNLKEQFLAAGDRFRGPLLDAALEFNGVVNNLHLDDMLAKAAGYMPTLVSGAAGLARNLGRGLESLIDDAGPVVDVLGDELPKIGDAFRQMFVAIGSGSEGGAQGLKDLIQFIEHAIVALGVAIGTAEKLYDKLAAFRDLVIPRDWLFTPDTEDRLLTGARALNEVGKSALLTADDLKALDSQISQTAITVDSLAAKMVGKIFDATMSLDQAVLGVAQSLTRLDEVMDKNGRSLDIHTAKGQANREAILAAVTANMELYQAQIAAGMGAEEAASAYEQNTAALEKQLRDAKLTQAEIDGLIGKYKGIPRNVNTTIAIEGLTKAINDLNETIRLVNGLKSKTITITVKQVGDNPMGQSRGGGWSIGGIRRAAEGMVVPPSDPGTVLFGEPQTGGEALIPLRGISQMRAMSLAQTVGDNYGFTVSRSGGGAGPVGPIALTLTIRGGNSGLATLLQGMQRKGDLKLTAG